MRILLLICLFWVALNAHSILDEIPYNDSFDGLEVEVLISYKLVSQNHLAQKERYRVSHVMNYQGDSRNGYRVVKECEIDVSNYEIMDDMPYFIVYILRQEKEKVLDCLYSNEVNIRESASGKDNVLTSRVSLEIMPTRARAMLLDKSIMLKILSKEKA